MSKSDGFGSGPPFDSQAYRDTLNFALAAPYENVLYALLTQHFYPCGPRSGMVQAHKDEETLHRVAGKGWAKSADLLLRYVVAEDDWSNHVLALVSGAGHPKTLQTLAWWMTQRFPVEQVENEIRLNHPEVWLVVAPLFPNTKNPPPTKFTSFIAKHRTNSNGIVSKIASGLRRKGRGE